MENFFNGYAFIDYFDIDEKTGEELNADSNAYNINLRSGLSEKELVSEIIKKAKKIGLKEISNEGDFSDYNQFKISVFIAENKKVIKINKIIQ